MPIPGMNDIKMAKVIKIKIITDRATWSFNSDLGFSDFFDFFLSRGYIDNLVPHPEQYRAPSGFFVPHL
jgi:hypothetical protein